MVTQLNPLTTGLDLSRTNWTIEKVKDSEEEDLYLSLAGPCPMKTVTGCDGEVRYKYVWVGSIRGKEGYLRPSLGIRPIEFWDRHDARDEYANGCDTCCIAFVFSGDHAPVVAWQTAEDPLLVLAELRLQFILWSRETKNDDTPVIHHVTVNQEVTLPLEVRKEVFSSSEVVGLFPSLQRDKLYYWERQGHITPEMSGVGKRPRRKFNLLEVIKVGVIWQYLQRGSSLPAAVEEAARFVTQVQQSSSSEDGLRHILFDLIQQQNVPSRSGIS